MLKLSDGFKTYTPEELSKIVINEPNTKLEGDFKTYTPEELSKIVIDDGKNPTINEPSKPTPKPTLQPKELGEEDKDPRIEQYQKLMESAPLGIVYSNPAKVYGQLDQQLISSLSLLESKLIEMTGNYSIRGRIVSGNNINFNSTPVQIRAFIDKVNKDDGSKNKSKVIEFKKYLKSIGLYAGDVESDVADPQLITALQGIEKQLAKAIGNDAVIGLIWQGNGINAQTSPEDVANALALIKKKKTAQSLDTFDVEEYQENGPAATKFVPTADDTGLETGDPFETQQIGRQFQYLPKQKKRLKILKMLAK